MPAQGASATPPCPLRIQKHTPTSSPAKMHGAAAQRPLSELGPMERRRNSPSFSQTSKAMAVNDGDSSPFEPSPVHPSKATSSPRLFWQGRDPASSRHGVDNSPTRPHDTSPSPQKRSSIENLKRASRVRNSNMFARQHKDEYDPTSAPIVERPLASGRPLSLQVQGNAFGARGINGLRGETPTQLDAPAVIGGSSKIPTFSGARSPLKSNGAGASTGSPTKDRQSPTKSSLSTPSKFKSLPRSFDPENATWSEEESGGEQHELPAGRVLHRHAKSVTFDAAPPQVNEYEMSTPDLSSVGTASREGSHDSVDDEDESFGHGDSIDRDDSFDASLEDTEKTPVVGPDDWRRSLTGSSPAPSAGRVEDPFQSDATDLGDDRRPLPPLPGLRDGGSTLTLPSAPSPVAVSKSDIKGIGRHSMSLEDRLRLMMVNETDKAPTPAPKARPPMPGTWMSSQDARPATRETPKEVDTSAAGAKSPSEKRISRAAILRKVMEQNQHRDEERGSFVPIPAGAAPLRGLAIDLDPDVPLPSTEISAMQSQVETTTKTKTTTTTSIKQESADDGEVDVYSIPDMYQGSADDGRGGGRSQDHGQVGDDDLESSYSRNTYGDEMSEPSFSIATDDGSTTPRATSPERATTNRDVPQDDDMSLPEFASVLSDEDLGFALRSYMSHSPNHAMEATATETWAVQRPVTPSAEPVSPISPEEDELERLQTPDSVIRHPTGSDSPPSPPPKAESPVVPDPVATVKAPGGRLKTRPSVTPSDMAAMAAVRRQVSDSARHPLPADPPAMPAIPERHRHRAAGQGADDSHNSTIGELDESELKLDLSVHDGDEDLSYGLDREFDRLLEAKKRGYLMRQNTKVIVASGDGNPRPNPLDLKAATARGTRSAGNSPRKASHDRTQQTWSVEPWNGKMRQRSVRERSRSPHKKAASGPVPPLPGQASNAAGGWGAAEDELVAEERREGVERGRLFVKVLGVRDLDLPLPTNEKPVFALTLDNGIHCVQTAWLDLSKNAGIGQEFELVVLDELEFTLTLQTEELVPPPAPAASPSKRAQKPSTFSRVFASPRKRKEMERKQQEEEQRAARERERAALARTMERSDTAWDVWNGLIAQDGSFGRSYFSLQEYEDRAYGRPHTVTIPCFNEWASEQTAAGSSTRSKHGGVQRRPPYQVGHLELQVLYVPKIKGATDEDMPKSLNQCIRDMRDAEASLGRHWEGHLSQQGGDCPYWRRRFFKLDGAKLTAYHEATLQPRATINLAKATKLIDDRRSLVQKDVGKGGRARRRSAFAEEEEGYMFVEEGFRLRFANGEVIDFYADSAAEKDGWMKVLDETVGKETGPKSWTHLVLARERASGDPQHHATAAGRAPPTPAKGGITTSKAPEIPPRQRKRGSTTSAPRMMVF
ncbi:MAG: Bud site selection protein bud4 [Thelocarpon superellum]|nr:MAG: Bud site selection protein bud4 [Thelocarpon superellum]